MAREMPVRDDRDEEVLAQSVRRDSKARDAVVALEQNGRLTPDKVLAAAEDPASPLHAYFEWDDDVAAHAHRIAQARTLIRVVRFVVTVEEKIIATPRYVRDPAAESDEQGYVSIEQLQREPENARKQVLYELVRARAIVERAARIAAALDLEADVRGVARGIDRIIVACEAEEAEAEA